LTPRVRYVALLIVMAAGLLAGVCSLQFLLHVGSCGNGPNSLANGAPQCPSGIAWKILGGVAGLLVGVFSAAALGRAAAPLALGLGFTMLGSMLAILGFIPAPGEDATLLGLALGAPFLIAGGVAFGFAARRYRDGALPG
jgi:hypothetical protein